LAVPAEVAGPVEHQPGGEQQPGLEPPGALWLWSGSCHQRVTTYSGMYTTSTGWAAWPPLHRAAAPPAARPGAGRGRVGGRHGGMGGVVSWLDTALSAARTHVLTLRLGPGAAAGVRRGVADRRVPWRPLVCALALGVVLRVLGFGDLLAGRRGPVPARRPARGDDVVDMDAVGRDHRPWAARSPSWAGPQRSAVWTGGGAGWPYHHRATRPGAAGLLGRCGPCTGTPTSTPPRCSTPPRRAPARRRAGPVLPGPDQPVPGRGRLRHPRHGTRRPRGLRGLRHQQPHPRRADHPRASWSPRAPVLIRRPEKKRPSVARESRDITRAALGIPALRVIR